MRPEPDNRKAASVSAANPWAPPANGLAATRGMMTTILMPQTANRPFPVEDLRATFPSLQRAGSFIFFDNAAGAQIPDAVLAATTDHLLHRNVQRGGPYGRSRDVDAMIARARDSAAAFVNARG